VLGNQKKSVNFTKKTMKASKVAIVPELPEFTHAPSGRATRGGQMGSAGTPSDWEANVRRRAGYTEYARNHPMNRRKKPPLKRLGRPVVGSSRDSS
jgi:hypothetical protein